MDYEKKYKEALERARALRNEAIEKEYVDDYIKDYETIFPELRESEDERIRKAIIEAIKDYWSDNEQAMTDCLAYLEKQKEPKPVEWGEEDNRMIGRIRGIIERYAFTQSAVDVNGELCEKEYVEMDAWLKSLLSGKRQTWGKEDERIVKFIIEALEFYASPSRLDHFELFVKVEALETKEKALAWLKSLRPQYHWRPSEEQISSLKQARDYYMSGRVKYVGRHLSEIAEQLEKLM